jgi:GNAT superfamily N-acetyltransferase
VHKLQGGRADSEADRRADGSSEREVPEEESPIGVGRELRQSADCLTWGDYHLKLADRPEEIEQIQRLLYRTFVLEIGQHPDAGTGRHVDKFHGKNTYLVAERDGQIKGMLAVHDRPPFSVADALVCKEVLERLCPRLLEVRLLAVERDERGRQIFGGLMGALHRYVVGRGYQYLAISGLRERQSMYLRMGFRPLGPAVRRGRACFVPMLLDMADLPQRVRRDLDALRRRMGE